MECWRAQTELQGLILHFYTLSQGKDVKTRLIAVKLTQSFTEHELSPNHDTSAKERTTCFPWQLSTWFLQCNNRVPNCTEVRYFYNMLFLFLKRRKTTSCRQVIVGRHMWSLEFYPQGLNNCLILRSYCAQKVNSVTLEQEWKVANSEMYLR